MTPLDSAARSKPRWIRYRTGRDAVEGRSLTDHPAAAEDCKEHDSSAGKNDADIPGVPSAGNITLKEDMAQAKFQEKANGDPGGGGGSHRGIGLMVQEIEQGREPNPESGLTVELELLDGTTSSKDEMPG